MINILKIRYIVSILFLFSILIGNSATIVTDSVNQKLIIYGDRDFPPYEYINEAGQPDGFNEELMKALLDELHLDYEIHLEEWKNALNKIETGKADILIGVIYSPERAKKFKLSMSHISIIQGAVIRKDEPNYYTIEDFRNKIVIVQSRDYMDDYLTNTLKFQKIIRVDNPEDGFEMLQSGKGDAFICGNNISTYRLKKNNYSGLKTCTLNDVPRSKYCIGISDNKAMLLPMINNAMYLLKQNGEYDRIYDKWLSAYDNHDISETVLIVLVSLVALLLISVVVIVFVRIRVRNAVAEVKNLNTELELSLRAGEVSVWKIDLRTNMYVPLYSSDKLYNPRSVKSLFDMLSENDRKLCYDLMEQFKQEKLKRYSNVFKYKETEDGKDLYTQSEMVAEYIDGKPAYVIGTLKDLTGVYYNNAIIKSKLKGLDMAMGMSKLVAWRYMLDTKRHEMLYGNENMLLSPFVEVDMETVHPDDRKKLIDYFDRCKAAVGEESNTMVVRIMSDSKYNYYEIVISKIIDDKADVVGYVGCIKDITVSFKMKEKYIYALNMAMKAAQIAISNYDIEKQKLYFFHDGEFVESIYTPYQLQDTIHSEDIYIFNEAKNRIISHESDIENVIVRIKPVDDTEYRFFELSMAAIIGKSGKLEQLVTSSKDINDRILDEQEVAEIKRRTDLAVRASGLVQWEYDCESDKLIVYGKMYSYRNNITPEEYVSKYVHDDYKASVEGSFEKMRKRIDKEYSVNIKVHIGTDDEWHYITVSGTSVKDYTNTVVRYTGFVRDETQIIQLNEDLKKANKEMGESNTFLNHVLERIPCGLFMKDVDNDCRYIMANNKFALFHNKHLPDILGKTDNEIVDEEVAAKFHDEDEHTIAYNGEPLVVDKTMLWYGKVLTWRLTEALFTTPNGRRYIIGLIVDISERERYRAELEKARLKAEESNRLKSAFLANMSHEIRTPLNAIVGFSELLVSTENEADRQQYINVIYDNNELLLRLISDVLDLSKIESGSIELSMTEFDFANMFNMCATSLRRQVVNPDVKFIVESPYSSCKVKLDEKRIIQVITNFVTNAVKFTQKGYIKIGYNYDGTNIYMYCEDSGSGIPEEKQSHIFERFYKVNEFAQGTGLGMAICKAIADGMNAEINLNSTPGKGSIFYFKVPCNAVIAQSVESVDNEVKPTLSASSENNENRSLKILVAEDIDSNFMLVETILSVYDLARAKDGEQVVEMCRADNYDVILMDMKMPKLDGLQATKEIRKFNSEVPIIALTANAFDSDRDNALAAGCNDFIAKPIKRSQLLDAIDKQIKYKQ